MADRGARGTWQYLAFWDGDQIAPEETLRNLPSDDVAASALIGEERDGELHYAAGAGDWHIWNGRCHARDGSGEIGRIIIRFALRCQEAAEKARQAVEQRERRRMDGQPETEIRKQIALAMDPWESRVKYIARLRAAAGQAALRTVMQSMRGADDTELEERHQHWLNFADCTVDLETGWSKPHWPGDMITYALPYKYNPRAACPLFLALLLRVCGSRDPEAVARYLLTVLGYCLLGYNPERKIFFINGPTSSGKSVLLDIIKELLGPELAHNSQAALITVNRHGRNARVMNSIRGKRLITITETSAFMTIEEGQVKTITGERRIAVDRHYSPVEITTPVTWCIVCATNQMPTLTDFDAALAERIIVIPAGDTIPEHLRDKQLADRIIAEEAEGILALLVSACARYFREGLILPQVIRDETESYRKQQNTADQFVEECCMQMSWAMNGAPASISRPEIYAGYVRWSKAGPRLPKHQFFDRLAAHPWVHFNDTSRRYEGISWRPDGFFHDLDRS